MPPIAVYALYKFTALEPAGLPSLRARLLSVLQKHGVRGTLLLAAEGINGTICGRRDEVEAALAWLARQPQLHDLTPRVSFTDRAPFKRTKVKIKREIVTMGVPNLNPQQQRRGAYVKPQAWNALMEDAAVLVVDTRNQYEVKIGSFPRAMHPGTTNFREFPGFAERRLHPRKQHKIALYCTGGIRCEKAAAYLQQRGFEQVFQLQGGILNYLAKVPPAESRWRGECFVFDDRVSVDHRLQQGSYDQCHACRQPLSEADQQSRHYTPGASCPACYPRVSSADRRRFLQRQKQVQLAAQRGTMHLGGEAMPA